MEAKLFVVRHNMPAVKQRVLDHLIEMPNGMPDYEVLIRQHDPKRNLEQNALAHVIVQAVADQVFVNDGTGPRRFSHLAWWVQLKREFFGPDLIELPSGVLIEGEPTSRDKGRSKFSDFIEFLYCFAAENGVELPPKAYKDYWGYR